jgi:hypothetical protein
MRHNNGEQSARTNEIMTVTPQIFLQNIPFIHLMYATPELPTPSAASIAEKIRQVEPLDPPDVIIHWEKQEAQRCLGQIQFGNHEIRVAGLAQPLPLETLNRTIHPSGWQAQIKAAMRQHQAHISLVYTGAHHDPIERMLALYKTAYAFSHENLLGIANENAWTAHPILDYLKPQNIRSYRDQLPFNLWIGNVRYYVDQDSYWLMTRGHHIFDVPDLAYFIAPGEQEEEVLTAFINIFYYIYEQDRVVTGGDTLSIQGTGQTMRFSEVQELEDLLMSPTGTLVVEKINPDEINPQSI